MRFRLERIRCPLEPEHTYFKAERQASWRERASPVFQNVVSRIGDIDRAFALRMPKCAGAPSHLIGKMHQRHAPSPASRKPHHVLTDRYTSLPGHWLTGIRILAVYCRSPARLEEIDIETGK